MNKTVVFLASCCCVVSVTVGTVVPIYLYKNRNRDSATYEVLLDGVRQEDLSFSLTEMYPGSEAKYAVRLHGEKGKTLDVTITAKAGEESALAPFVRLAICHGEERVDEGMLSEYLQGRQVEFSLDFSTSETREIALVYSMGVEVGDEAQNASADFTLTFSSKE